MSLFIDQPPISSPAKPKLRPKNAAPDRLRMLIGQELENHDITTPATIGAALSMPGTEVIRLLILGVRQMPRLTG